MFRSKNAGPERSFSPPVSVGFGFFTSPGDLAPPELAGDLAQPFHALGGPSPKPKNAAFRAARRSVSWRRKNEGKHRWEEHTAAVVFGVKWRSAPRERKPDCSLTPTLSRFISLFESTRIGIAHCLARSAGWPRDASISQRCRRGRAVATNPKRRSSATMPCSSVDAHPPGRS